MICVLNIYLAIGCACIANQRHLGLVSQRVLDLASLRLGQGPGAVFTKGLSQVLGLTFV